MFLLKRCFFFCVAFVCEALCGRLLMWHAPRRRLPGVTEKRRIRSFFRREQMAVKMAVISAQHHSAQRCCSIATQTDDYVTTSATFFNMDDDDSAEPAAPVTDNVAPAPDVTCAAPAPVIEYVPDDTNAAPAPEIQHVALTPDETYAPTLDALHLYAGRWYGQCALLRVGKLMECFVERLTGGCERRISLKEEVFRYISNTATSGRLVLFSLDRTFIFQFSSKDQTNCSGVSVTNCTHSSSGDSKARVTAQIHVACFRCEHGHDQSPRGSWMSHLGASSQPVATNCGVEEDQQQPSR